MKIFLTCLCCVAVAILFVANTGFKKHIVADDLRGAWIDQSSGVEQVVQFVDGYATHTIYSKKDKQFIETRGGTYTTTGSNLNVRFEFDTKDKEVTGQSVTYPFTIKGDELTIDVDGNGIKFKRVDNGSAPLTGVWHITGRMQEGKMVSIHQTGTRKTLKILSGTRFQWAAIDPGVKGFFGTGGGVYEFKNGKYTEHIEFFSRDSSRVGASLPFDGKLEKGDWHHSGLSSKGDKIYEVWSKVNKTL